MSSPRIHNVRTISNQSSPLFTKYFSCQHQFQIKAFPVIRHQLITTINNTLDKGRVPKKNSLSEIIVKSQCPCHTKNFVNIIPWGDESNGVTLLSQISNTKSCKETADPRSKRECNDSKHSLCRLRLYSKSIPQDLFKSTRCSQFVTDRRSGPKCRTSGAAASRGNVDDFRRAVPPT